MTLQVPSLPEPTGAASARLDVQLCVLEVPAAELGAQLARERNLELGPLTRDGLYPVCIELWSVRQGRMHSGNVDQARAAVAMSALSGAASGALALGGMGALVGGSLGSMAGALFGPLGMLAGAGLGSAWAGFSAAALGASAGAQLAERGVTQWSSAASRVLGQYNEVLIGVPEVRFGSRSEACYGVLRMYTDSVFAHMSDRIVGYGFGKQLARFERSALQTGLYTTAGQPLLAAVFEALEPAARALGRSPRHTPEAVSGWLCRPLLGVANGRAVRSQLQRSGVEPEQLEPLRCALLFGDMLDPALAHAAPSAPLPVLAYGASPVDVQLGWPAPVGPNHG